VLPASVSLQEVGPRDGLQNEARHLTADQKVELVERLAAAGLRRIEAGSFVHPQAVPQMADSELVFARVRRQPGVTYAGLVLNERGYQRARAAGVDEVHFSFGVTPGFNQRNQRAAPAESFAAFCRLAARARAEGLRTTLTFSVAFGCPFDGRVDPGRVADFAARGAEAGFDELVLADTIGVAVPTQVTDLVRRVRQATGGRVPLGCHFHNTRNTALANAYAALVEGVTVLDAAVGGCGGCPFAPNATGNVATEDLVYMLHGMGVATGVDLEALIAVAAWLEALLGHRLEGMVMKAGPFRPLASA
jgi:isopropylmalate/homocitrate/citramalate synthase